ncbi:glycoside hydrolase family 73 protein [Alkalibacterium olivapovliticus]|uniref:Flagellum-specific peptidoglycan hydrolase FlgJ n=1 Tax=Alkalibacterium olivapovliticus TaxID=99907 RepID=A0A2T0W879_9LACT|nr:glycoside hydrolase family 73 protein [Alkalibacterium olivapovliticus]PRY82895.1 flagellum-specific peptidoglycan hydrolase FlgJ [Alkalibacterium olivapovliticus]
MAKKKTKHKGVNLLSSILLIFLAFIGTLALLASSIERGESPIPSRTSGLNREEFIENVASYAVPLQETHGIKPSITIAQAIVESNWGESGLAVNDHNYFGIKGDSTQPSYATLEYEDEWVEIQASFRSYASLEESVKDYAELIAGGTNWNPDLYKPVVEAADYKEAAHALKASGYATDPNYPIKLIEIVELYDLDQYDN